MTIQEFKEKYKDDADALNVINDLEAKLNINYLNDNIKLKAENEKLKQNNELLYNQIMNGTNKTEEPTPTSRFKDYSNEIEDALKNR